MGNEVLIIRGMIEIALQNIEETENANPEMSEKVKAKLEKSLESIRKVNGLLQRAKSDYLYKESK